MREGVSVLLIVLAVCVQSCTVSESTKAGSFVDFSATSIDQLPTASTEGTSSDEPTLKVDSSTVPYLESVIPPCVPVDGSDQDPCADGEVPYVAAGTAAYQIDYEIDDLADILLGEPVLTPHIVVRGTVISDTTRCELYQVQQYAYETPSDLIGEDLHSYSCFVEVRVNEYIVGRGPTQLTVIMHREPILVDRVTWPEVKDDWLEYLADPRSRTATAYEGREAIMFLEPSTTVAVEAWSAARPLNQWFLQRRSSEVSGQAERAGSWGEIRAVTKYADYAKTDAQRRKGNRALAAFVKEIRKEASARTARTGGRIGVDADLPLLVTDAGRLRDFYLAAGADYDGDDRTTVMPPPVPGQVTTSTTAVPTSTATTVQVERPGTPRNVAVSDSGVVTWDPPGSGGPVTSYIVYVSGHGNITTGPDDRSADISHWIEESRGSTVRVYVIARNSSGWSRDSGIVTLNL